MMSGPGLGSVQLVVSGRAAKKLRLTTRTRSVVIGRATSTFPTAGTQKVILKLTGKARSRLRRVAKLAATLQIRLANTAGKATTVSMAITIRR